MMSDADLLFGFDRCASSAGGGRRSCRGARLARRRRLCFADRRLVPKNRRASRRPPMADSSAASLTSSPLQLAGAPCRARLRAAAPPPPPLAAPSWSERPSSRSVSCSSRWYSGARPARALASSASTAASPSARCASRRAQRPATCCRISPLSLGRMGFCVFARLVLLWGRTWFGPPNGARGCVNEKLRRGVWTWLSRAVLASPSDDRGGERLFTKLGCRVPRERRDFERNRERWPGAATKKDQNGLGL